MIYYKTAEEIEKVRESCGIVCKALAHVASMIKPGITGKELDREAEALIRDLNAEPGFKGYRGFPNTLCISINEAVVHGIPQDQPLKDGDIVSIDCGALKDGYYGDSAYTFALGEVSDEVMDLLSVTRASLYRGIDQAREGNRMGDIGFGIQELVERQHGYSIVRDLVGHGIGANLHEAPEVPNYGKRGRGIKLKRGLVIAIEPMVNLGRREVRQSKDGWTVITRDRKPSAHFEHTVAIGESGADILSNHDWLEEEILKNEEVRTVAEPVG